MTAYCSAAVSNSTSPCTAKLQACNTFRMYNGKAAENELKTLAELSGGSYLEHDLIRHNLVVFRGGDGALQVRKRNVQLVPLQQLNRNKSVARAYSGVHNSD